MEAIAICSHAAVKSVSVVMWTSPLFKVPVYVCYACMHMGEDVMVSHIEVRSICSY